MWRFTQYNLLSLKGTWNKCWMWLWGTRASPPLPTPSLRPHCWVCTQNTEAIKLPLPSTPWVPVTKALVSSVQAADKAGKGAQPSCPSQQASAWKAQERWVCRGREQIIVMSQVSTVCCVSLLAPLFPKLGLPNRVLVLCFSVWPFWIASKKWNIGLLRFSVSSNQSHTSPLSFSPQELMD